MTNSGSNTVSVIDTTTKKITATVPVGHDPVGVEVSPDGTNLYVVNNEDNSVYVINTITYTVSNIVTVGKYPNSFGQFIKGPVNNLTAGQFRGGQANNSTTLQSPISFSYQGIALCLLGKYEEAIQAFDKAIKIDPQFSPAWDGKGVVLHDLSRYNESIQAFDKAIEINPQDAVAWDGKGVVLYDTGRYNESIQAFDKAIEINPQYAEAWNDKGNALNNTGRYNESIQAYDKAIGIKPNYTLAGITKVIPLIIWVDIISQFQLCEKVIEIDPQNIGLE